MISLGVWACQWRELRPMSFGGKAKQQADPATLENGQATEPENGEGFSMGGGERGRDGAGTYEMVGMAPREPA